MSEGYLSKDRGFVESINGHDLVLVGGYIALDGSGGTPITTGLSSIVSHGVHLNGSSAPGLGTSTVTSAKSGGTITAYPWKPTGAGDTTLVASAGTETISWWALGRK